MPSGQSVKIGGTLQWSTFGWLSRCHWPLYAFPIGINISLILPTLRNRCSVVGWCAPASLRRCYSDERFAYCRRFLSNFKTPLTQVRLFTNLEMYVYCKGLSNLILVAVSEEGYKQLYEETAAKCYLINKIYYYMLWSTLIIMPTSVYAILCYDLFSGHFNPDSSFVLIVKGM